ncbi:DMT family transporter [Salibacterium aidingense]|uniref:DMT family transporter n=1 Tax=Salibacterium aidingense TaxID=384933 RepID=UPI003BDE8C2B
MNVRWLIVIIAALCEVIWVIGLKLSDNVGMWFLTILFIIASFILLVYSGKRLPTSTAYAVFVALGTVGTVIIDMLWFNEAFSWAKVGLLAALLIGVIGLKLVTSDSKRATENKN